MNSNSSPPTFKIVGSPEPRIVVAGKACDDLFSVSATSPLPIKYRWQFSFDRGARFFDIDPHGGVFIGCDTGSLGVKAGMTDFSPIWNGALFRCIVESGGENIFSGSAHLTVVAEMPESVVSAMSESDGSSSSSSGDDTCGGAFECGGTMYHADCGLLFEAGQINIMDCDVCECVTLPLEYFASSSSSTELPFSSFLEISFGASSSSSSSSQGGEALTVLSRDPQLNLQALVASKQGRMSNTCLLFANDEQCPDGYYLQGFADNCVGPCDKICCPISATSEDPMICGRAYRGAKSYNSPWQFHLDPNTVRLAYRYDTSGAITEKRPSDLENELGSEVAEGSECCFEIRDSLRQMKIVGPEQCYQPLELAADRVFDADEGEFVQQTSCQGNCDNIVYNYCLDSYLASFESMLDDRAKVIEQQVDSADYLEVEQEFLDDLHLMLAGIDGDLTYVPTLEEIENALLAAENASSSSSEYFPPLAFDYQNEPIPTLAASPTVLPLEVGGNFISSLVGGDYPDNFFRFSIDSGRSLVGVYAIIWESLSGSATMSIQEGTQWDGQSLVGEAVFGFDLASSLLSCGSSSSSCESPLPLGAGDYSMKVSSAVTPDVDYVLLIVVE